MMLPLFITKENKGVMALFCGLAFLLCYSVPNHFHYFAPQLLPMTEFDRWVPFLPWTIFVYISEYVLFASAYFLFKEDLNRNRYIWAYFGVLIVGAVCFVLFPTTYPRSEFPITKDVGAVTYFVFSWLRTLDDPSNCFPSMHVTCCYITAFSFLPKGESRVHFWVYFMWATIVGASTLPTKQHYVADVLSGFALSVVGYWFFFKRVKYLSLSEYVERIRSVSRAFVE